MSDKTYIAVDDAGKPIAVGDDALDLDALLTLAARQGGSVQPKRSLVGQQIGGGVQANGSGYGARDPTQVLDQAETVASRYIDLIRLNHEVLVIIGIGQDRRVVCEKVVCGGPGAVMATMRDIFREVLVADAAGVILVHNHPSGRKEPSRADIAYTERTEAAGKLLGVKLVDHVIVATGGWTSWRLHWSPTPAAAAASGATA